MDKISMIFLLNNIKFGHPKLLKYQIDYFDKYFIPMLSKKIDDNEIIISGDIFYNTKNINFSFLIKILDIFKNLSKLAKINIIDNNYCYELFSHISKKIENKECPDEISLFHFSKEEKINIGYYVGDEVEKFNFIENKISPRFIEYKIENIEDIDNIEISNDFITLEINSDLFNKSEYKNKIDIFLSKYEFDVIFYTEIKKEENKIKLDTKNTNIRNILLENIDKDLEDELKEVFNIYDDKNKF